MNNFIEIEGRRIGEDYTPFVIAEVGINHEGSLEKAIQMVDDASQAGCECIKFQTHIIEDEMVPNNVIPGNAKESIWDIMDRCKLSEDEEIFLKKYVESKGMLFLSTPFSRAAADRLENMRVQFYKIGSGECNNYPLIKHVSSFGKPIILSTGMNNLSSIQMAVNIFRENKVSYALLHCTSMYPTPYEKVRLGALVDMRKTFPDAILGLSDHSLGNYTCFGAVPFGASILEKHFTSNKNWPGPDINISIDPQELMTLIEGSKAIHAALGGSKEILSEEKPTIDFAYACCVTISLVKKGEILNMDNIWVKRPGTGTIKAKDFEAILGKRFTRDLNNNHQISWEDIDA